VVEAPDDPGQVAHAVAVGVGERPRVDLVDHGVAPPRRRARRRLDSGGGARLRIQGWLPGGRGTW
jgi:hypothetical protein